jgi:hypothetical protein
MAESRGMGIAMASRDDVGITIMRRTRGISADTIYQYGRPT